MSTEWDYLDLIKRLRGARKHDFSANDALLNEAINCICNLIETNKSFHRRVQEVESLEADKEMYKKNIQLKRENGYSRASSQQSFQRMMNAHDEIKIIYEHLRRAYPDGCDGYGYHSVMDSRADGRQFEPGTVWANRFKSATGGIVSVRPAAIVGPLIDELLWYREFMS